MTSPKKKILEEILPLRIIREVEKWPVLYVRDSPEMTNTHFKNKVWNEVAKALIEDWDNFSQAEKKCKIMDLVKKWRNLRDTFKRQIIVDRKIREGHDIKKKKYVYFKHMSFLLPHMQLADAPGAAPPPRRTVSPLRRRRAAPARPPPSGSSSPEHIDEDKHFLMSLLPSLKRMDGDEKLTAKMEILKVIKTVRSQGAATAETFACRLPDAERDHLALAVKLEPRAGAASELSDCSGLSDN